MKLLATIDPADYCAFHAEQHYRFSCKAVTRALVPHAKGFCVSFREESAALRARSLDAFLTAESIDALFIPYAAAPERETPGARWTPLWFVHAASRLSIH